MNCGNFIVHMLVTLLYILWSVLFVYVLKSLMYMWWSVFVVYYLFFGILPICVRITVLFDIFGVV